MTVPAASKMKITAIGLYGQQLGPEAEEYLDALLGAVEKAWTSWQSTLKFGGNKVSGAGVGAFAGAGGGGVMTGGNFALEPFVFKKDPPELKKFTQGLADAISPKFTAFPTSYKIGVLSFVGVSGATPVSPGPVQASNVPMPLMTGGMGQNPSGIADVWKTLLTKPEFDLTNPQCKSGALVDAIGKAIEQEFQSTWLLTAQLVGNSLATAGAAGGVVTNALTGMDGVVA